MENTDSLLKNDQKEFYVKINQLINQSDRLVIMSSKNKILGSLLESLLPSNYLQIDPLDNYQSAQLFMDLIGLKTNELIKERKDEFINDIIEMEKERILGPDEQRKTDEELKACRH